MILYPSPQRFIPSPLRGEGQGEGDDFALAVAPSPQRFIPSPSRGEGQGEGDDFAFTLAPSPQRFIPSPSRGEGIFFGKFQRPTQKYSKPAARICSGS